MVFFHLSLFSEESKPEQTKDVSLPTWTEGFQTGAMLRVRPEMKYNFDFNKNTNDNVDFVGQKLQFWIQKEFSKDVFAKITFQDARVWGGEKGSPTGLSTANDNTRQSTDIREAYLEVKNILEIPLHVQMGRQLLKYGDERLVGALEWTNVGRSFDGLRVKSETKYLSSHIWVTAVSERHSDIVGNTTIHGQKNLYNPTFNCPPDAKVSCKLGIDAPKQELGDSYFTGFYNTIKPSELLHIDLYYLGYQKEYLKTNQAVALTTGDTGTPESRAGRRDILHTYGIRLTNKTLPNKKSTQAFDYSVEYAMQSGTTGQTIRPAWDTIKTDLEVIDPLTGLTYQRNLYSEKVKYKTYALGIDIGYTIDKIRLGAGYDVGSGDPNRSDGSVATFQNLFHTNHAFYGMADQISWVNMKAKSVNFTYNLEKYGTFRIDYFAIEKHKLQDSWYDVSGTAKVGASTESLSNNQYNLSNVYSEKGAGENRPVSYLRRSLFREIDFKYSIPYRSVNFELGYSLLFAGDAIRNRVNDNTIGAPGYFANNVGKTAQFAYLMMTISF